MGKKRGWKALPQIKKECRKKPCSVALQICVTRPLSPMQMRQTTGFGKISLGSRTPLLSGCHCATTIIGQVSRIKIARPTVSQNMALKTDFHCIWLGASKEKKSSRDCPAPLPSPRSACINWARVSPNASANGSNVLISGKPSPRSQRLMALSVTWSCSAKALCVRPLARRVSARNVPNAFASIEKASFVVLKA